MLPFGWLVDPIYEIGKNRKKIFVKCEHICPDCHKKKKELENGKRNR